MSRSDLKKFVMALFIAGLLAIVIDRSLAVVQQATSPVSQSTLTFKGKVLGTKVQSMPLQRCANGWHLGTVFGMRYLQIDFVEPVRLYYHGTNVVTHNVAVLLQGGKIPTDYQALSEATEVQWVYIVAEYPLRMEGCLAVLIPPLLEVLVPVAQAKNETGR